MAEKTIKLRVLGNYRVVHPDTGKAHTADSGEFTVPHKEEVEFWLRSRWVEPVTSKEKS